VRELQDTAAVRTADVVVPAVPAFEDVVVTRYDDLRRTALVLCGDHGYAEDLVQGVLAKAHRSWARVARADDLDAYLHTAVVNASRSWWRRRWHGEVPAAVLLDTPRAYDATAAVDLRVALVQALQALPRTQREAVALRFLAGLTEEQTAVRLGVPAGTVKSRVSRGLATLRTHGLLDEGDRS
jgi:RNA polymerase sigma-70 factor, ECF subfamily